MIHSLYWPGTDPMIVVNHRRVMDHFNLDVQYYEKKMDHGAWMDEVMQKDPDDIVMFFDIDAVPSNMIELLKHHAWVKENKSFLGISQVSNHIKPCSHIFAAPAFLCVHKEAWEKLNRPTFREQAWADVAENFSYAAEMAGLRYKTLYPIKYQRRPENERWYLHTYGEYGIGTWFEGGIFHLYQGRIRQNQELFEHICNCIVSGKADGLEWIKSH